MNGINLGYFKLMVDKHKFCATVALKHVTGGGCLARTTFATLSHYGVKLITSIRGQGLPKPGKSNERQ